MSADCPKTRANRLNAARSTGPKTAAGKARSAQNAHRHGLAVPVLADSEFAPYLAPLTHAIAGPAAGAERLTAAARIAEAQIELLRVRQRRLALFERHLVPRGVHTNRIQPLYRLKIRRGVVVHYENRVLVPVEPWDAAEYFSGALQRLERYERRALSRQLQAVAAFDALVAARQRVPGAAQP